MKIIDAHVHLWDIARFSYPWLEEVLPIKRDYLIEDYRKASAGYDIESIVFVQCECLPEQALEEINFVEEQAKRDDRVRAVVAYAPLENDAQIEIYFQELKKNEKVKGVRRMTGSNPGLGLEKSFIKAVQLLPEYDLSFDLSIKPFQVPETIRLIEQCPQTNFILDHLGKPDIANKKFDDFKKHIAQFSSFPNVGAKISGLITEADWGCWKREEIEPYVHFTIEQFGFDRLLFGSDWPVVLLAGTYKRWIDMLIEITTQYSEEQRSKLFYHNAKTIYRF